MDLKEMRIRGLSAAAAAGLAAVLTVPAAGAAPAARPLTPRLVSQLSQGARQPVIVLLRDQHPDVHGQRRAMTTQNDQRVLVDQAKRTGATDITQFTMVNGFAATMTPAERDHLAGDPRVQAVVPDLPFHPPASPSPTRGSAPAGHAATPGPGACPADPAKPLLEPEALQVTHAAYADPATPQAQSLATGKGVRVAYLADSVDTGNPDFVRPDGGKVFADYQDFTGEGTGTPNDDREAFGDASAIAAQGRQTYDLSTFVSPTNPLPAHCDIKIRGMAPDASLVGLKVIASNGFGSTSAVVQAIDYAINVDHVDVLNESLGANPYPDHNNDPFTLANRAAVAAGVTVVASSGDAGYGNTVDSPASDPTIISAGASTTYRLIAQTRTNTPGFSGAWQSGNISAISSSGVAENGQVDDLVAPGDLGWALCTPDLKVYLGCRDYRGQPAPIQAFGGTSQASPLVAGAAALVIEAYGSTHGGARPSPALVKQILTSTATDGYDPADRQGAGLLNALAAVQAAKSVHDSAGSPAAIGNGLLFGSPQLTATGEANSDKGFDLTVTNAGATTQTVTGRGRTLSLVRSDQRGSVRLDTTTGPTFPGSGGALDDYVTQRFTVPVGADHLDASAAWSSPSGNAITMVLLDPTGAFAGYTMPQAAIGTPDFGHVDVHSPAPGTWTALVYSAKTLLGFNGPINYEFRTTGYQDFGTVSPASLKLVPGQTGTLHIDTKTPQQPGDLAAALQVDAQTVPAGPGAGTPMHQRFAVPVILRSLVGNDGHGTFSGVLTGGNGRGGAPAQTNTYRFDVPAGKHDVDVSVTLHGDVNQAVTGYLVSPDGQIVSQASNVRAVDVNGNPSSFTESLQSYKRLPVPGRWSYLVVVTNPVSGSATQEPFTGQLQFDQVDVRADNLPSSATAVLPGGRPTAVTVHVHNTGAAPARYFTDARSLSMTDVQLIPQGSAANVPLSPSAVTPFVVPTGSTELIGVASGSAPVSADLAANTGEPEVLGPPGPGNTAVASVHALAISQGTWLLEADQVGPFAGPAPAAAANLAVVAHTQGFDPSVTSSTGDHWLGTVQAQPPAVNPLELDAGQTGTITVTVTPRAAKGTVVTGYLYVDDTTVANNSGDELIAIPYAYTVG